MEDADNSFQPTKKRAAEVQLTKENLRLDDDDEHTDAEGTGTFKKASDEVLASRRIVKVRRQTTSAMPSAPSSNPFAGICLVPPTNSSAPSSEATTAVEKSDSNKVDEKNGLSIETKMAKDEHDKKPEIKVDESGIESTAENMKTETDKEEDEIYKILDSKAVDPGTESTVEKGSNGTASEASKPELTDAETQDDEKTLNEAKTYANEKRKENEGKKDGDDLNANGDNSPFSSFQRLSSSQNAFTGLVGSGFSSSTFTFGPIPTDGSCLSSGTLSSDGLKNGTSSLFSNAGTSVANKSEGSGIPSMQVVTVETGEENEKAVFAADSVLFEFLDGRWKERGKGEIKVNVPIAGNRKARLVMRARGNYRLILNASLYSDIKLTAMEKKGITFACVNSNGEGKESLSTFALKFKDASIVEEFREIVSVHKVKPATATKTPENSP